MVNLDSKSTTLAGSRVLVSMSIIMRGYHLVFVKMQVYLTNMAQKTCTTAQNIIPRPTNSTTSKPFVMDFMYMKYKKLGAT